jgi:hypothetical protein
VEQARPEYPLLCDAIGTALGRLLARLAVNNDTTPARRRACSSRDDAWPDSQTPAYLTTDGTATNAGDAAAHGLA